MACLIPCSLLHSLSSTLLLAVRPDGERVTGSVEEQTHLALQNVLAIVEAAGGRLTDIAKTTVYVPDVELWGRVNAAYAAFFCRSFASFPR